MSRITSLLVANRGEIAIRAFRAAVESGRSTVAVYAWEDRGSPHRAKADMAFEIGERGHPVHAYLDVDAVLDVARVAGADGIYPGYGFLSENPALAEGCAAAGLAFVGPPAEVLRLCGNKVRALAAAEAAGVPVLRRSPLLAPGDDVVAHAGAVGFPLFVKAAAGGGGRGMRLVEEPARLVAAVDAARREARAAFGDEAIFLEQALIRPRHIEVQLLADASGEVVHLFERDCSIQRRHQKVVEIAPAPNLEPALRERIIGDAVRFARACGYVNAGTAEFLVDTASGAHVFIEMNPRIQVEHTVTEEITHVDLVRAQIEIAAGATLAELGLEQGAIRARGFAIQCRVTTEDPADDWRPAAGRLVAYRAPGGAGIRLDDGNAFAGAEVTPFYDSLLVKLIASGNDFATATARARRALEEFRIRGVATNLGALRAIVGDPAFAAGELSTAFIAERPHLTEPRPAGDRATRLARFLADRTVNGEAQSGADGIEPATLLPPLPALVPGSRDRLRALGAERFAAELRAAPGVAVTDTTLRDAHQSVLATRVRTYDLVRGAAAAARLMPQLLSLECWGGASYDVALRFLFEDPWQRLEALREAAPNVCLQMLLRGRNTVGYTPYPDAVCHAFVAEAARTGVDVFRIFDANNDPAQIRPAVEAARAAGGLVEGCLCYTGDLERPDERLYTLDYYLGLAEALDAMGAHVLCIKDMAGLLRPAAATRLVTALRARFPQPVHLHTHDTSGGAVATYAAAIAAGVDAVDGALGPLSGMSSQPNLAAVLALCGDGADVPRLDAALDLEPYWDAVRRTYRPFEMGLNAPTGLVYRHEIPGGQLSNLRAQAEALGLGARFAEVSALYGDCDRLLGRLVKVTPTSKVVGDLALHLAGAGLAAADVAADPERVDLPDSVVRFLQGELGTPPGGFPEPLTARVRARHGELPPPPGLVDADRDALADPSHAVRRTTLDRLLFPGPAREHAAAVAEFGDVAILPTRLFLDGLEPGREEAIDLGPGVRLLVELETIADADPTGYRTVYLRLNGQPRTVDILDRAAAPAHAAHERADPDDPGHVGAPLAGNATCLVAVGDAVERGDAVVRMEAMKMETTITASIAGTVARIPISPGAAVRPGELLLTIVST